MPDSQSPPKKQGIPFEEGLIGVGAFYGVEKFGPLLDGPVIGVISSLCALICIMSFAIVAVYVLNKIIDGMLWVLLTTPKGHKGQAQWASWTLLRCYILRYGSGPYWGMYERRCWRKNREIITDYSSNAMTVGSAGSGKGVSVVIPNILSIRSSKLLPDFKGVNSLMVKDTLQKRGERFVCLNIGNVYPDKLETEYYNPLNLVADNFTTAGNLIYVVEDVEEITNALYPDPVETKGDSRFWDDGARFMMAMSLLQNILVYGEQATLGHANQMVNDKSDFLRQMQWASGRLEITGKDGALKRDIMPLEDSHWRQYHDKEDVENFITWYKAKASSASDLLATKDSKVTEAFLSTAQNALKHYNITSHAHKVLSKTTFRFRDMKGKHPVTAAIAIDATRLNTQLTVAGLLQTCALMEFKRCKNSNPVYVIADECTNYKINDLTKLLTFGREYGIRMHLFIQSLSAFEATYGEKSLGVLLSETEIKQFLPQTREPKTLDLIEKLLGDQSYIGSNHNGSMAEFGIGGYGFAEDIRKLMTADEIRRTSKAILFIRNCRPVLAALPSYAEIEPFKYQVGINPFFGRKYIKRTKLRIGHRRMPIFVRLYRFITTGGK